MKTKLIALLIICSALLFEVTLAQASPSPTQTYAQTNAADYIVRVTWTKGKDTTQYLQMMTTEGGFQLSTSLPTSAVVQAGRNHAHSSTVTFSGELQVVNSQHARLRVQLGYSVPVVEVHNGASTYQYHQEGFSSSFIVTFGKAMVIQKDPNGEVIILVKRESP